MSLRLLPAFAMDNEEDDDGNFTKWMSSYWGHGAEVGQKRERKRSFRRSAKKHPDRRASLPTVSQLDAMKLNRLHAAMTAPSPSHIRAREEKVEVKTHQRAHHVSSADNTHPKSAMQENRIATIPEIAESFERRLCLHDRKTLAPNDDKKLCLICHEDRRRSGGGVQCMHRFHKECMDQWLWKNPAVSHMPCPCVHAEAPLLILNPHQSPLTFLHQPLLHLHE